MTLPNAACELTKALELALLAIARPTDYDNVSLQ